MAFKSNAAKAAVIVPATNNWEKAAAFINVTLNTPNGKKKVGALPLRLSKLFEAALIERLSKDDAAIEAMIPHLEFDFQLVNSDPIPADALGF